MARRRFVDEARDVGADLKSGAEEKRHDRDLRRSGAGQHIGRLDERGLGVLEVGEHDQSIAGDRGYAPSQARERFDPTRIARTVGEQDESAHVLTHSFEAGILAANGRSAYRDLNSACEQVTP
jgi:hypothetical protein